MTRNYFAEDNEAAPYTHYGIITEYVWESGLVQLPNAAPAPPGGTRPQAAIVGTFAAVSKKIVRFSAVRLVEKPVVPHPESSDPSATLARARLAVEPPMLTAEGMNRTWRVSGEYEYIYASPFWILDTLACGTFPFDTGAGGPFTFGPEQFSRTILGGGNFLLKT